MTSRITQDPGMKDDGGAAFPDNDHQVGMSLRDWFAGQALMGMLASPPVGLDRDPDSMNHNGWARNAYYFADAMLAERAKGER